MSGTKLANINKLKSNIGFNIFKIFFTVMLTQRGPPLTCLLIKFVPTTCPLIYKNMFTSRSNRLLTCLYLSG